MIAPICPSCNKICEPSYDNVFMCPRCGGYYRSYRLCPVCRLPGGMRRQVMDTYGNEHTFYSHEPCFKLIDHELTLDMQQYDADMEIYRAIMSMKCPACGDVSTIYLLDAGWVCIDCGVIFDDLNDATVCIRCGEHYNLSKGHVCELRTEYILD